MHHGNSKRRDGGNEGMNGWMDGIKGRHNRGMEKGREGKMEHRRGREKEWRETGGWVMSLVQIVGLDGGCVQQE